jgi:copper binding plastocyanin/azurin family protein
MTQLLATFDRFAPRRVSRPRALFVPLLALLVALVAVAGVAFGVQAAVGPEPRTVTLLARDMSFYLPGDTTPNPRLIVGRGERVRFVLRNEQQGVPHDLAVEDGDGDWETTRVVRGAGESAGLTFRAPERQGEYPYLCTLHSRMMRGVLEVR